jgi:hypothetical protein
MGSNNIMARAKPFRFEIVTNTLPQRLNKYFRMTKPGGSVDIKAKTKMGLQLLNNIINGSTRESVVPPVLTGLLRGSGSVFVGSKLVHTSAKVKGKGNPNTSHRAPISTVTIGLNASYTAELHEKPFSETKQKGAWSPGPVSRQSGDVGNKFVEKHLKADAKEIVELYASTVKKETGG